MERVIVVVPVTAWPTPRSPTTHPFPFEDLRVGECLCWVCTPRPPVPGFPFRSLVSSSGVWQCVRPSRYRLCVPVGHQLTHIPPFTQPQKSTEVASFSLSPRVCMGEESRRSWDKLPSPLWLNSPTGGRIGRGRKSRKRYSWIVEKRTRGVELKSD